MFFITYHLLIVLQECLHSGSCLLRSSCGLQVLIPSLFFFSVDLLPFFMPQGFQSLLPFQVLPNHLVTNLHRSRYHLVEKEHDSGEGSHFGKFPIITEFGSNQEEHQVVQPKTSLIPISGEGSHLSGGSEDRAPAAMARAITVHVDTMKVALTILVKRSP